MSFNCFIIRKRYIKAPYSLFSQFLLHFIYGSKSDIGFYIRYLARHLKELSPSYSSSMAETITRPWFQFVVHIIVWHHLILIIICVFFTLTKIWLIYIWNIRILFLKTSILFTIHYVIFTTSNSLRSSLRLLSIIFIFRLHIIILLNWSIMTSVNIIIFLL